MGSAEFKVPEGKLVEAKVEISEGRISEIRITGDFYMHPEEEIEELERSLLGTPLEEVKDTVHQFFREKSITLVGIKPEDFARVILMAAQK
ncbi:MAG: lipoate protein ligase C-terminal domain-containing protein [Candidatus Jordarchaeaceae archaeon]